METDINRRVRKVLMNTALITSISIITYLLYSTIDKNKVISEKNAKILVDSMTLVSKMKELKTLKTAYETLEAERNSIGLANDSLMTMVASLNEYIEEVERKEVVNTTKLSQLNVAINEARKQLAKEKEAFSHIDKSNKTETASQNTHEYYHDDIDNVEVQIDKMELEPISKMGKTLTKENVSHDQIKYMRVKFIIMKNALTYKVQKVFSVQLIEPDGKPYKFNPDFDCVIIDRNKVHLTNRKKIEFDGNDTHVTFLYPKATPFKPGMNIVKLYYEDRLIAEKTIQIN